LGAIKNWCRLRNALVHELVTLNNYQEHERAFSDLAKEGAVLAKLLYSQTTHFRNVYYNTAKLPPFPPEAQKKCQLIKKTKQ